MLILERTEETEFSHITVTSTFKTCDSCGEEFNMVEYFLRVREGKTEAVCPSCGKHHLHC